MPQRRLLFKICIIAGLLIGFAISLTFVQTIVHERQSYHHQVIGDISHHQISHQTLISPFISVPYTYLSACDAKNNPKLEGTNCTYQANEVFFPQDATWEAKFAVTDQEYQRTIYHAISYISQLSQQARFENTTITPRQYQWENAKFILPIKDLRGLKSKPILTIGTHKYSLDFPKHSQQANFNYVEITIPNIDLNTLTYTLNLELEGLESFSLIPTNENLRFNVQGNWADAKFMGDSLPLKNHSSHNNFTASWNNLTLGYQNQQRLSQCWNNHTCRENFGFNRSYFADNQYYADSKPEGFAVEFIKPINIYSQTDRAIKYGWIITLITFGCFFLFEMLKGLRIHPIQYLLVGTAQSIFFILLLSLSEQISFIHAYLAASIACIGLMSWYLSFILKAWRSTALFTILISTLYAVMYLLLQSAEKTFLMGSIFSFFIIAVVMYITRHIDWYQIHDRTQNNYSEETIS